MITIEDVLHPVTVPEFIADYWGEQALYIPGAADKFASLYSLERFKTTFSRPWPATAKAKAVFDGRGGNDRDPLLFIAPDTIPAAYRAGATVCITWIDKLEPALAALCRDTKLKLGYLGDVRMNAYWSPDGAGFRPHFDARIATTLQLEGTKRWRYNKRPILAWPHRNEIVRNGKVYHPDGLTGIAQWERRFDEAAMNEWEEVVLHPGDVLCLPAGALHSAEADGHSFALNLHFNAFDTGRFIGRMMSRALEDRAPWRHVPPLLADEQVHGGPNAAGLRFLEQRLDEAIALLGSWRENVRELATLGLEELARAGTPPISRRVDPSGTFTLCSALVVATPLRNAEVVVLLGDTRIDLDADSAAVLRRLVELGSFEIDRVEVPGLAPADVRDTLLAFVEHGIAVPESARR